jgi:hypothetical protein
MAVILLLNYRVLQVQTYGVVDATAIAAGVTSHTALAAPSLLCQGCFKLCAAAAMLELLLFVWRVQLRYIYVCYC